jgi:hypothetical protein
VQFNGVRDERAIWAAERAWSSRGQGRPEARGAVQIARSSREKNGFAGTYCGPFGPFLAPLATRLPAGPFGPFMARLAKT